MKHLKATYMIKQNGNQAKVNLMIGKMLEEMKNGFTRILLIFKLIK